MEGCWKNEAAFVADVEVVNFCSSRSLSASSFFFFAAALLTDAAEDLAGALLAVIGV